MNKLKEFHIYNKQAFILIFLLVFFMCGCNYNNEDELAVLTVENNYYINKYDYTTNNKKITTYDKIYAYQFLEDNKCNRVEINGKTFYKDGKVYEIPEGITLADKKESQLVMSGLYISKIDECTYKLRDGKISITTKSDKEKTIKGEYKFNNKKLEVVWDKDDTTKAVYENKEIEFYIESYADIILSIKDLYDYYETTYSFQENLSNKTINKIMSVDVWAEKTIELYNADIKVDDFLELNDLEQVHELSGSSILADQTWFNETSTMTLNVPIEELDYDGIVTLLAKKNKVDKTDITIRKNTGETTLDNVEKYDVARIEYNYDTITNILK